MKIASPKADARLFDLIADDDAVRGRALARHRESVASGTGVSIYEPGRDRTVFWYLGQLLRWESRNSAVSAELWPFVALYLRWETLFPDQWTSRDTQIWSPWSMKEGVLGHLGRCGLPTEARPEAIDLLVDVVHRPYRCKDWMYALLVRHVDGADFRDRMAALARAEDPLVRCRAQFLLDVADRPEVRVKRNTWGAWLDSRT
ncbi:hypothetical protein PV646_16815 [Streptomyces sp. ID05-26A]|nr:hypothetical protein [Streptomyces sp. ID05-26A]